MIHWIKTKLKTLKLKWLIWFFKIEPDEAQKGLFEYCQRIINDELMTSGINVAYEPIFRSYMDKYPLLSRKDVASTIIDVYLRTFKSLKQKGE